MNDAERAIRKELQEGETLLWSGRPRGGLRFRATDLFLVPFSLLWAGFVVFWEVGVLTSGAPPFFALFGVPFVAMGIYLVVGRFFVDAMIRARTAYGVTDRRAIAVGGSWLRRVRSVSLDGASQLDLSERRDGSGTLRIGATGHPWFPWSQSSTPLPGWPGGFDAGGVTFDLIDRVRDVHDILTKARSLCA